MVRGFSDLNLTCILCYRQILSFILAVGLLAYLRTVVAGRLRESGGESRLFWCGAVTQAGSFVGALVMFPLVNVYHLFQSSPPCGGASV
jgi:hypothetical protein